MVERLKVYFGYLLAAVALAWVLHGVHIGDLADRLVIQHPAWLLVAVIADISSYVTQGVRWRLFLKPAGRLSTAQATQAIYAGLFMNEVVPMRLGEVGRAYLASRWLSVRFSSVLTSLALERLTDGVWLAVGVGLAAMFLPLPSYMIQGAKILGVLLSASIAVLFLLVWFGRGAKSSRIDRLARSIHSAGTAPAFWLAFATSSLILILQGLAFWFVMRAYGLPFNFWTGTAVYLIVHLGTVIPNAPANIGTFQFFVVAGLTFFGLDKSTAVAFSFAVFLVLTLPLWLIGFFALSRTGFTLSSIRAGIKEPAVMAAVDAQ